MRCQEVQGRLVQPHKLHTAQPQEAPFPKTGVNGASGVMGCGGLEDASPGLPLTIHLWSQDLKSRRKKKKKQKPILFFFKGQIK